MPLRSFNDNRFIFEEVGDDRRRSRADLQRAELPRVPPERRDRRRQPDRRASHRARGRAGGFFESLGGSLIQSRATQPDDRRARRVRGRRPHVPHLDQHARQRLRRVRRQRDAAGDSRCAAGGDARHGAHGAGARRRQRAARRPLRLEEPAREPRVVLGRCLSQRDGHHQPAVPGREHLERPRRRLGTSTIRSPDPEDDGVDVVAFANFMRSTKAPSRGPITRGRARRRDRCSTQVGCNGCHVSTLRTARGRARASTAARSRVPSALGNKIIHPYSDFLLHDIGTGDGIPVLPTAGVRSAPRSQIRTAPLWALRTRNRLMHDGLSFTKQEAIQRHAGQARRRARSLRRADGSAEESGAHVPRFAVELAKEAGNGDIPHFRTFAKQSSIAGNGSPFPWPSPFCTTTTTSGRLARISGAGRSR